MCYTDTWLHSSCCQDSSAAPAQHCSLHCGVSRLHSTVKQIQGKHFGQALNQLQAAASSARVLPRCSWESGRVVPKQSQAPLIPGSWTHPHSIQLTSSGTGGGTQIFPIQDHPNDFLPPYTYWNRLSAKVIKYPAFFKTVVEKLTVELVWLITLFFSFRESFWRNILSCTSNTD